MDEVLEKDAKVAESSSADKGAKGAGSPPAEELIAENKRKAEKIATLEAKLSTKETRLAELERIETERGLTEKQEQEKSKLGKSVDSLADELERQDDTKPWVRVAERKASMAELNSAIKRANYFIDDKAHEHGIDSDSMANKLKPYAFKHTIDKNGDAIDPDRRNILAYRDWQADQSKSKSLDEREKAIKAKEDAETKFREGAGRYVRDESLDQKFEKSDKKGTLRLMRDLVQTDTSQ